MEAITANFDTSSVKQKLGDVLDTKWKVPQLIVGSYLFLHMLSEVSLSLAYLSSLKTKI